MARSAKFDPVLSCRFDITIISLSLSPSQIVNGLKNDGLSQFSRAGFSTCTVPESSTTVTEYRENVDNFGVKKIPGLTRFNDITLTRGVIVADDALKNIQNITDINLKKSEGNDFVRWVHQVASFNPTLSTAQTLSGTSRNTILRQSNEFRKDMMIVMRDREGKAARRWYLLDVWPTTYKGGSDLDAASESISMESLTLTYEVAFELPSALNAASELVANIYQSTGTDFLADIL